MPTIALVNDDHNVLSSLLTALKAEGYRVATYIDGTSALDGFQTAPPDLAILDIKMPRMEAMLPYWGRSFARTPRNEAKAATLPHPKLPCGLGFTRSTRSGG